MIKNNKKILALFCIFIILMQVTIYSFSDDLFEFDLPDTYGNLSYEGFYIFADSENEGRGISIVALPNSEIKKSVWDLTDSEISEIASSMEADVNAIGKNTKCKLGKEKAIMFEVEEDGKFFEMYILGSNNYMYAVTLIGETKDDLSNADYEEFKSSFKLKDRTTNFKALEIIIIIIAIIIGAYFRTRPKNNPRSRNINNIKPLHDI